MGFKYDYLREPLQLHSFSYDLNQIPEYEAACTWWERKGDKNKIIK